MPTTRFASANEKSNSTGLDTNVSIDMDVIRESREQAFNLRKKREVPADLTPKQKAMIQSIDCIIEYELCCQHYFHQLIFCIFSFSIGLIKINFYGRNKESNQ